jgi:DNA-binding HxlR family transcriptional regulator
MDWLDVDTANCSIGRTLDVVGQPWTFLVLREAYQGVRRFDQMQRHLGVARPVLSRRLSHLVESGLLERVPYREPGSRPRDEYQLTGRGRELYPVLLALLDWGDAHLGDPGGPSVRVLHRGCGHPVHVAMRCEAGHGVASVDDVESVPGPGARPFRAA